MKRIDYNDISSPIVKYTSIRILLAIVAVNDLELEQLDVKTTFLHRELEGKKIHVFLLKKFLYGLKQSLRQWYKRFDSFIITQGFSRSKYDICIYLRKLNDGSFNYL